MFDAANYADRFTVMERDPESSLPASRHTSCATLEDALTYIQGQTGSPVLIKTVVETQ
jgi:hypothetical protein